MNNRKNYILISSDEPIVFSIPKAFSLLNCHIECRGEINLHYPNDCELGINDIFHENKMLE